MTLRPIEQLAARFAAERDAALAGAVAQRRAAGIVHTPAELARALVRVSDELLRAQLGLSAGVCEPGLLVIDPACGPGAFLAALLACAEERGTTPITLVGYDIDEAALAWAERLRAHPQGAAIELLQADVLKTQVVAERAARHAGPLLVIGNPPWATVRAQPSALDQARLAAFRRDETGTRLAERKLGVLSDAYVRFFALCAELARTAEAGALVALVSNGSFLDGPVHRGMRARLLEWFDQIFVLDLGGSALLGRRREQRDDNVFGVRPNVAVSWLCRYPRQQRTAALGRASYARCFGSKSDKLSLLRDVTLASAGFRAHACQEPAYSFVPRPRRDDRYASWPALPEWLPFHREGVQSNRDALVMDSSAERLLARLQAFGRGERLPELKAAYQALPHYDPARARAALVEALARDPQALLQRIAYRPWEERVFCTVAPLCHRPRPLLRAALAHGGIALVSVRKDRGDLPWRHASAAASIIDNCYLSARSSCRARAFPSFTPDGEQNLSPLARELLAAVGCESSSLDLQHYALALLSAASYQSCWDSELHHDYPRVPPPPDAASFYALAALGARLVALHSTPCKTSWSAPAPEASACYRDIELELVEGQVALHGSLLIALAPAALQLRVGHWQPLSTFLAQRASLALDRTGLSAVYARAERLGQLAQLQQDLDSAVVDSFGRFRRA